MLDPQSLAHFTGTHYYYRHLGLLLTDGAKYVAEKGEAYWLFDILASHQSNTEDHDFQVWQIETKEDAQSTKRAVITMTVETDSGDYKQIVRQDVQYTDFPLESLIIWVIGTPKNRVAMLPREY